MRELPGFTWQQGERLPDVNYEAEGDPQENQKARNSHFGKDFSQPAFGRRSNNIAPAAEMLGPLTTTPRSRSQEAVCCNNVFERADGRSRARGCSCRRRSVVRINPKLAPAVSPP